MAITQHPAAAASSEDGHDDHPQQHHPLPQPPAHPVAPLHQHTISNASTATVDIEAWTISALESLNITPQIARGTSNSLSIPLDTSPKNDPLSTAPTTLKLGFDPSSTGTSITPPRRPPSRRDSMKKRDALLKGNPGSRQRRRWENDHLLGVPNAQPPLPSDYLVQPTYPVLPTVPYQLASYWDRGLKDLVEAKKQAKKQPEQGKLGHIPQNFRATAKRTPAVGRWLKVLEEPVRRFVVERGLAVAVEEEMERQQRGEVIESESDETDPEDEEIVFVGKGGRGMREGKPPSAEGGKKSGTEMKSATRRVKGGEGGEERGMVLDTAGDDEVGGAFKRWLTHSISDYYGLDSKSVVVQGQQGGKGKKVIFVGVKKQLVRKVQVQKEQHLPVLPPPLWEMF
ncbi:R3H-associated N-terminal domain-containing protein [Apiosordaria backusii]|uniref:R3H-associated N-terminal domain-containing protein n=1 Tax=Apiosordaria backusii TaxID=314023 RepID=A0AA40ESX2_9PEZI|nr:R3H-associated N-terminal domain-containing protein [Apiosordaria backusii]